MLSKTRLSDEASLAAPPSVGMLLSKRVHTKTNIKL
jgi:hypothetical protein